MCGITGYVGDDDGLEIVHEGLQNLEYRGYDSAGVAVQDGGLRVHKREGEVSNLELPTDVDTDCGIGHTRWSTHGEPTDRNAHPHTDCRDDVAVVHNGIIENHASLKTDLEATHLFDSDTDTEVIPHLLEDALADVDGNGDALVAAMQSVTDRLAGSYAIAATTADADGIVAARQDSPLVVGHGDGEQFLASDVTAFIEHTRRVTFLENGDLAYLTDDGVTIYNDGTVVDRPIQTVDWDADAAEKGGYPHYMLKEIHEQPQALRQALAGRIDDLAGDVDLDLGLDPEFLRDLEEIQVVAAGTSYHAGLYAKHLLEAHADVRVTVDIASEYRFTGGRDPWNTLVLAITQSGETADTLAAVREAADHGVTVIAVTNTVGSSITRAADDTVFIRAGPEIGVAATKTFVSQVATLALLAVRFGRERGALTPTEAAAHLEDIHRFPGAVQQVLDAEPQIEALAETYADADWYFFIARAAGYPVALESALKLKEISYVHAEGFPAGELKHGPLALVTGDTVGFAVLTAGADPEQTAHNVQEVKSRGADVVAVTSDPDRLEDVDATIPVPAIDTLEPVLANVALQLFAYHVADHLDRPIDKPRNLAKSVTVE